MEKKGSYDNQTVIVTKTYKLTGTEKATKSSKKSEKPKEKRPKSQRKSKKRARSYDSIDKLLDKNLNEEELDSVDLEFQEDIKEE